jgi:hypothetical protein
MSLMEELRAQGFHEASLRMQQMASTIGTSEVHLVVLLLAFARMHSADFSAMVAALPTSTGKSVKTAK